MVSLIGKGPQTFSTVFTRITGDFGLVAQNPLFENGLLFMILSQSVILSKLGLSNCLRENIDAHISVSHKLAYSVF